MLLPLTLFCIFSRCVVYESKSEIITPEDVGNIAEPRKYVSMCSMRVNLIVCVIGV